MKKNYKFLLAYDGSLYFGFQKTKEGPSIQEHLEKAFTTIFKHEVQIQAASRTDRGVHAMGQVINICTSSTFPKKRILAACKGLLPKDISIYDIQEMPISFHPTLDAKQKIYTYFLSPTPIQMPFHVPYSWHYPYPLSIEKMKEAASYFLGTHNFLSFTNQTHNPSENPIRTIEEICLKHTEDNRLVITVKGKNFLYKMVRNLVGTLVYVGRGKIAPQEIPDLLKAKDRRKIGMTAPAHGLVLKEVTY